MTATSQNVTEIQLSSSELVLFYVGDEIVNSVSRVVPPSQTFIMRDGSNIMILQSANEYKFGTPNGLDGQPSKSTSQPFVFNVKQLEFIGGKDFPEVNPTENTADAQLQAKAISVYNWLVQYVFKGCCECGCDGGCSINYSWNEDLSSGQFYITEDVSESTLTLSINVESGNGQDLDALLAALPNGSWITFIGSSDATLFSVVEITGYSIVDDVVTFDLELIDGQSTFTGNPKFCVTFQPALGGGGGSQDWQETLIVGSDLTQDNTVDAQGTWSFYWDGFVNWILDASDVILHRIVGVFTTTHTMGDGSIESKVIGSTTLSRFFNDEDTALMEVITPTSKAILRTRIKLEQNEGTVLGFGNFRGLEYEDSYEGNFSNFSLVTKQWVLALAAGVQPDAWKQPCEVATTGNITLSGEQTIDGVLTDASRVLVWLQTDPTENGIYESSAGAWTRTTDADLGSELEGAVVYVQDGSTYATEFFRQTTVGVTIGVSDIIWALFTIPTTGSYIISILRTDLDSAILASLVTPNVIYCITDASPAPIYVKGVDVDKISTEAELQGTFDGSATTYGGFGTYDISNDLWRGLYVDLAAQNIIIGRNEFTNSLQGGSLNVLLNGRISINGGGSEASLNLISPGSFLNGYGAIGCFIGNNTTLRLGTGGEFITTGNNIQNFDFGDNFKLCHIWSGLNGNKADDSDPIDFITNATLIYNRTSPWEIIDIDRTAELIYVRFTYGDGSDPEEGWYDPATDTFTPIAGGSTVWGGITGTLSAQTDLQAALDAKQGISVEVTTSITAANGENYIQTASATYTDPTGVQGQGYEILVVAGTATVDGIAYANVGTKIYRYYNASAWVTSFDRFPMRVYQATGQNASFGASSTRYFNISGIFGNNLTLSTQAVYYFAQGGTFSDFRFETNNTQPASGSLVITLMSGSNPASLSASTIAVTFAAGSAAGVQTSGNTLTISAGDYVCFRAVNNASAASAHIGNNFINFVPNP